MEPEDRESVIADCLRYIRASKLPTPLPTTPAEYRTWQKTATTRPEPDEAAEDAWFELDRLIDAQPEDAWRIIIEVAARCCDEAECAQLAAGPLTTFMRGRRKEFAPQIAEELTRNGGFRTAFAWLQ